MAGLIENEVKTSGGEALRKGSVLCCEVPNECTRVFFYKRTRLMTKGMRECPNSIMRSVMVTEIGHVVSGPCFGEGLEPQTMVICLLVRCTID